jgi:dihydroorotase
VIVDPDRKILVDPSSFASKGRATPFDGCTLYGDILLTIYDGSIVYRNTAF